MSGATKVVIDAEYLGPKLRRYFAAREGREVQPVPAPDYMELDPALLSHESLVDGFVVLREMVLSLRVQLEFKEDELRRLSRLIEGGM